MFMLSVLWKKNDGCITFVVTTEFPCSASFLSNFSFASLSTSVISFIEFPCRYRICRDGNSQNTLSQNKLAVDYVNMIYYLQ